MLDKINVSKDVNLPIRINPKPLNLPIAIYNNEPLPISKDDTQYIIHLNEFTNSPTGFDSPLFFDVKKYLSRDEVKYPAALYDNDVKLFFLIL